MHKSTVGEASERRRQPSKGRAIGARVSPMRTSDGLAAAGALPVHADAAVCAGKMPVLALIIETRCPWLLSHPPHVAW